MKYIGCKLAVVVQAEKDAGVNIEVKYSSYSKVFVRKVSLHSSEQTADDYNHSYINKNFFLTLYLMLKSCTFLQKLQRLSNGSKGSSKIALLLL